VRGQVPKAYVVARGEAGDELASALQQFVRERLGAHEFPRVVEFVAEIPTTPAGKINRKALREREAARAVEASP
jgi:acetyl-CoA synthetase